MLAVHKQKIANFEKKWCHVMSREVIDGLKSLSIVVTENKIEGVHGPLYENLNADSRYFTCIDVTAGNKLFNVLVDTSQTATKILKITKERKLDGQITFMPLDHLHVDNKAFPKLEDAIPLLSKIHYDSRFEKAFKLVFGHTLLCRNKDVAYSVAKEHNADCVTLDGDQVYHRGSIIGGYIDSKLSILEIYHHIKQLNTQVQSCENELKSILQEIDDINNEINKASSRLVNEESVYNQNKFDHQNCINQLNNCNQEITQLENYSRKSSNRTILMELSGASNIDTSQSQSTLDLSLKNLSHAELEDKMRTLMIDNSKIIDQINSIESSLNNNLYLTFTELQSKIKELETTDCNEFLSIKTADLSKYQELINESDTSVNKTQEAIKTIKNEINDLETNLEKDKIRLNNYNAEHSTLLSQLDALTNKISLVQKKLNETENHMQTLGITDDLSRLKDKSIKWLWKNMNMIESQLQKSTVNKRAAEDYIYLSSERDKSVQSHEDLLKSLNAIHELINRLDKKKNETTMFTFKQVSYHFTNIFTQLFPEAHARLILRRNPAKNDLGADQENDIDVFSGVGIQVTFDKEKENMVEINQLSGGQKTLVTLALIFALQKCDPVPIYLFDEVDQALDPYHRQTFARMLNELSENGQFIVTTFRPEILSYSPQCFMANFKNRVSTITQTSVKKAKSKIQSAEKSQ